MHNSFQAVKGTADGSIRLVGELDLATVATFRSATERAVPTGPLTLDLAELTYIDSSGLHAIVECAKSRNGGGGVRIVNASDHVLRVLEIVNLNEHSHISIDRDGRGVE